MHIDVEMIKTIVSETPARYIPKEYYHEGTIRLHDGTTLTVAAADLDGVLDAYGKSVSEVSVMLDLDAVNRSFNNIMQEIDDLLQAVLLFKRERRHPRIS